MPGKRLRAARDATGLDVAHHVFQRAAMLFRPY
jgi:hypothetical protein